MSYTLFEIPQRTARRREHRCIWCGGKIAIGTNYLDERSVYDGQIQRQRWHVECHTYAQDTYFSEGEDEFTPFDNEPPPKIPPA